VLLCRKAPRKGKNNQGKFAACPINGKILKIKHCDLYQSDEEIIDPIGHPEQTNKSNPQLSVFFAQ
jgi:hypothetical protein